MLILALGIGASTALYSVWKSALVFPFEFERSGRWVAVLAGFNRQRTRSWFFSVPEYNDLRQLGDIFEGFTVLHHIVFNLTDDGHPESLDGTAVSADAIRNTGVQPILGRSFLPGEDAPGGPNVLLLGYDLWQNRYQGDPNILGRQIRMNDENYTVIGVMPRYFRLWGTPLWVPLRLTHGAWRAAAANPRSDDSPALSGQRLESSHFCRGGRWAARIRARRVLCVLARRATRVDPLVALREE